MALKIASLVGAVFFIVGTAQGAAQRRSLSRFLNKLQKKQEPIPGLRSWDGFSYFLSNDGVECAEGPADVVEGALALRKAGLAGSLYNTTFAQMSPAGMSCAELGYTYRNGEGEDSCYPGVTLSYRTASDAALFRKSGERALEAYANQWGLESRRTQLLFACTCHPESTLKLGAFMECSDALNGLSGSWAHRDPADQRQLMCDGGPFLEATLALAVLKSTAQLPMHQFDQIAPVACDQLGFPHMYSVIDHCFAGLHIWYKTRIMAFDKGLKASGDVENELFSGGFERFEAEHGLNDKVLNRQSGCHCSPHSEVGIPMQTSCSQPGATSPIRSWFTE